MMRIGTFVMGGIAGAALVIAFRRSRMLANVASDLGNNWSQRMGEWKNDWKSKLDEWKDKSDSYVHFEPHDPEVTSDFHYEGDNHRNHRN